MAASSAADTVAPAARATRVASIDIIRGAVMILMAIDHVRVYSGLPAGGPTPGIFFTRWITHFCAPAFIFLAGTSAFFYGRTHADLSRFLLTRGLWLVLLELTVLRFAWTFNADYANFTFAGVIWVIGWCMILMAALVRLPVAAVGAVGAAIVAGHNLVGPLLASGAGGSDATPHWLARLLYLGGSFEAGGLNVVVLYTVVPWVGVMAAGYAFGPVMRMPADRRRRVCLQLGGAMVAAFLLLRGFNLYGDPRPWTAAPPQFPRVVAFLNTAKYPASLMFLLMTLGPTILLLPMLEWSRGAVARWLGVFGRVPFFYYVLHIPLIHAAAVAISLVRTPDATHWLFANHPMLPPDVPDGYQWSLGLLYLVTAAVVTTLYFPCRWFASLKSRRRDWWLSFL